MWEHGKCLESVQQDALWKCGLLGMVRKDLKHFGQMCEGVEPNEITFVSLLSACRLAGLVDEGMHCYTSMITIYKISAKLEHDPAWLTLLVMSIYSLYNFCKIRTLPLHGSPCW